MFSCNLYALGVLLATNALLLAQEPPVIRQQSPSKVIARTEYMPMWLDISPSGYYVAVSQGDYKGRGAVTVYHINTGREVWSNTGFRNRTVTRVQFMPVSGKWTVVSCVDGTIRIFDSPTGKPLWIRRVTAPYNTRFAMGCNRTKISDLDIAPDESYVVVTADAMMYMWDLRIPAGQKDIPDKPVEASFMLVADESKGYNDEGRPMSATITRYEVVNIMQLAPGQKECALVGASGRLDTRTIPEFTLMTKGAVSSDEDDTNMNVEYGQYILFEEAAARSAWPCKSVMLCGRLGRLLLWDCLESRIIRKFKASGLNFAHDNMVLSVDCTADGRYAVSCGGSVYRWGMMYGIDFGSSFTREITHRGRGAKESCMRIWDIESGREIACYGRYVPQSPKEKEAWQHSFMCAKFTPDRKWIIAAQADGTISAWPTPAEVQTEPETLAADTTTAK